MIIRLVEQNLNLSLISLRSFPPSPIFFLLFLVLTFPIRISILSIFSPQIGKKKKESSIIVNLLGRNYESIFLQLKIIRGISLFTWKRYHFLFFPFFSRNNRSLFNPIRFH